VAERSGRSRTADVMARIDVIGLILTGCAALVKSFYCQSENAAVLSLAVSALSFGLIAFFRRN